MVQEEYMVWKTWQKGNFDESIVFA